jgi:hypothetical protein
VKLRLAFMSVIIIIMGGLVYNQTSKLNARASLPEVFEKLNICVTKEIKTHNYTRDTLIKHFDDVKAVCKKEIDDANVICPELSDYISCALAVCNSLLGMDYNLSTTLKLEK